MFHDLDQLFTFDLFAMTSHHESFELHDGERREVAILFADIHGFTALSERLDSEQVRMILDKLLQLFTGCIKHYGGYIDKYEGDLVMTLFGAKVASERDMERAVHAALLMLEKLHQFNAVVARQPGLYELELTVRIGINTGVVTTGRVGEKREGDFTVYGDAVNVASRMESNAPLNRIMLPHDAMCRVNDVFEFEDYGKIRVKGKSDPIKVYLVKGVKAQPLPRWHVYHSVYVGREHELATLQKRYETILSWLTAPPGDDAVKPLVVGITGPAGIGKSRLLGEFLSGMPERCVRLQGAASRLNQPPYSGFTSMIKHYLGITPTDTRAIVKTKFEAGLHRLAADVQDKMKLPFLQDSAPVLGFLLGLPTEDVRVQLTGQELQPHIQTAIRYFLEVLAAKANRAGEPLLVMLEDMQWLDEASRAVLEVLLMTLNLEEKREQRPLKHCLFLLTYRPEYEIPKAFKCDAECVEIDLAPLDGAQAETLLHVLLGNVTIPDAIQQHVLETSSGNPFYLEEWVNLIKDIPDVEQQTNLPVPATLTALILSRIDQLEQDLKLLLQKAAVIGKEFLMEILTEVERRLQRSDELGPQLASLEAADMIRSLFTHKYSAYLFKHVLTQEVAYNTLLIANRKMLHRLVADVIETQFADHLEEFYYDLADHYSKAEIRDKAIEYLEKAGDKANVAYEYEKALELYDRLLTFLSTDDQQLGLRVETLFKKVFVVSMICTGDESQQVSQEALSFAERTGDTRLIGRAHRILGLHLTDYNDQQMRHYETALELLQTVNDQAEIAKTLYLMGNNYMVRSDYANAMILCEKALSIQESLGDKRGIVNTLFVVAKIYMRKDDYAAAIRCYKQAVKISEELGYKKGTGGLGVAYMMKGEYDLALDALTKNLRICEETGAKAGFAFSLINIGSIYFEKGEYDHALENFERSLKTFEEIDDERIAGSLCSIGDVYREKGDYDTALEYYDRAIALSQEFVERWPFVTIKRELAEDIFCKATALYLLKRFNEAQALIAEALRLSQEISDSSLMFSSRLLAAKIDHAFDKPITSLSELLTQAETPEQEADIHYASYECGVERETHRQAALRMYQELYAKTPKFAWKKRIAELEEGL